METDVARVADRLREIAPNVSAAIILGSGWGPLLEAADDVRARVGFAEVGLRPPVAPGHDGQIAVLEHAGGQIVVFSGRTHLYEGHGPREVAASVRVAAALGATTLVVTNSNGSLRPEWELGDVVVLTDHLNFSGVSPLVGPDFVDLSDAYSPSLRARFKEAASAAGIDAREGVYAMLAGPHYETPAEARALATLGADVVGMSTVLETIAARGCGMEVLGLSIVSAIENSGLAIDPDEVVRIAEKTARTLSPIVLGLV